ncbi:hypothetical protein ANN_22432 [Periplaneta americana]|uniref:Uncharacterized protein n=1 Tax=Periplaneta americana TaxID=6978 RepID=A0ABQ8S8X5_PERAM|nr:hypothetical protein ANN_22432 [Periplaneta americana]
MGNYQKWTPTYWIGIVIVRLTAEKEQHRGMRVPKFLERPLQQMKELQVNKFDSVIKTLVEVSSAFNSCRSNSPAEEIVCSRQGKFCVAQYRQRTQTEGTSRKVGRPQLRWLDEVEKDIIAAGVKGWKTNVLDRRTEKHRWGGQGWNPAVEPKKKKKKKKKKEFCSPDEYTSWLFNDAVSTIRLFSVDGISVSEMVFVEIGPRIRHRVPDIRLQFGENLGKNPTSVTFTKLCSLRAMQIGVTSKHQFHEEESFELRR